jgi:hypothetical protein
MYVSHVLSNDVKEQGNISYSKREKKKLFFLICMRRLSCDSFLDSSNFFGWECLMLCIFFQTFWVVPLRNGYTIPGVPNIGFVSMPHVMEGLLWEKGNADRD